MPCCKHPFAFAWSVVQAGEDLVLCDRVHSPLRFELNVWRKIQDIFGFQEAPKVRPSVLKSAKRNCSILCDAKTTSMCLVVD